MKPDAEVALWKGWQRMNSRLVFCLGWIISITAYAQQDIPVGTWRSHNSYNSLVAISNSSTTIYAAGSNALFTFTPGSNELTQITGLTGLSDVDIATMGYNVNQEALVIAYKNGNIDILQNSKISNFTDLLRAEISGAKKVNHIYNYQQYSYLSTDFGVLIIDLATRQVKDTYFELGPQGETIAIYGAVIANDSLYLAHELGVMRGSLQDNLKDFNQWLRFGPADNLPATTAKLILATPYGLLAAFDNAGVFAYKGTGWASLNLLTQEVFRHGAQNGNNTLLTTTTGVYHYDGNTLLPLNSSIGEQPAAALYFGGTPWLADAKNGLIDFNQNMAIYPNGPYSNEIVKLYTYGNKIIAMPRAHNNAWQPLRGNLGYFQFSAGEWQNFNSTGYPHTEMIPEFADITGAAYLPATNTLFLSSFGYGLLKIDDQGTTLLDETNSPLVNASPPARNVLVTAISANGNEVAAINFSATPALHLYDNSGKGWLSFTPAQQAPFADQIISLGNGTYWLRIASTFGGGIVVYDAINNRSTYLTRAAGAGDLPDNKVYDMALDREGKMWVATAKGVVFYYNAAYLLDDIMDPVAPIFDGQILFKDEKITALAVDGGNRIWMGTTSGAWLFANDGQEEEAHFTAEDGLLPTNDILDIEINQQNGEVFFATRYGLVSYRGTSTTAGQLPEVKIFPNPVLTTRDDIVTLEGVPDNADLWITDASGRLVYKTRANGNTAIWSGIAGNTSLSSGVYFVFIASEDGSEKQIGKIAIIN